MDPLIGNTPRRFTSVKEAPPARRLPRTAAHLLGAVLIISCTVLIATPSNASFYAIIAQVPRLLRSVIGSAPPPEDTLNGRQLREYVAEVSRRHGVPPSLTWGVIAAGSKFDPNAVSRAGAVGLMQVMPQTASEMGVGDVQDPRQNILGGVRYLRMLLDKFEGDQRKAVTAYRIGPLGVESGERLSPASRKFVDEVLSTQF